MNFFVLLLLLFVILHSLLMWYKYVELRLKYLTQEIKILDRLIFKEKQLIVQIDKVIGLLKILDRVNKENLTDTQIVSEVKDLFNKLNNQGE